MVNSKPQSKSSLMFDNESDNNGVDETVSNYVEDEPFYNRRTAISVDVPTSYKMLELMKEVKSELNIKDE